MPRSNSVRCSGRLTLEIKQVQVMELRRVDPDERTRQEVGLLLVVALESHCVARLDQRLQCLDDRSGLQDGSLHPRREPGQARGFLRPAARPTVRLFGELHDSIHLIPPGKSNIPSAPARRAVTEVDTMDHPPSNAIQRSAESLGAEVRNRPPAFLPSPGRARCSRPPSLSRPTSCLPPPEYGPP